MAGYHIVDYRYIATSLTETATATFAPQFPSAGVYEVAVWYVQGANRPTDAKFIIHHAGGATTVSVDQTTSGSRWVTLGQWEFPAAGGAVAVSNQSATAGKVAVADAVRFVRAGTSYGDKYQGMWIYSWGVGFRSEAETDTMLALARDQNMNILFPEVRKAGDAYYISAIEPRADNIDPDYADPLADLIAKAHDTSNGKQYIEVHAWIVPYRVWVSGGLPEGHVLTEHPDWVTQLYDGSNTNQYLDAGHPGVTDYLVDVVTEIVRNYDVDGVHFDYFRYAGDTYGYNPTALARFQRLYNRSDRPAPTDPEFGQFRRDQILAMGRKVYAAVKAIRWNVKMSAATIGWGAYPGDFTQSRTYKEVFQDWPRAMEEGILDMNVLMNYKREHVNNPPSDTQQLDYRTWLDALGAARAGRHAVNGPGVYMNYPHNGIVQVLYAMDHPEIAGNNYYVYHSTHTDYPDKSVTEADFWAANKADCFFERRDPPAAPWLESPTFGILRGTVTINGAHAEGTAVALSGGAAGAALTDGTGFYAFLKAAPGEDFLVTASAPGYPDQTKTFSVNAGEVTTVDFTFPAPEPTPTITPAPTPTEPPAGANSAFIIR